MFRSPKSAQKGATAVVEPPIVRDEVAALQDRLRKIDDMIETERESSLASERARLEAELVEAKRRKVEAERDAEQRRADEMIDEVRDIIEGMKPLVRELLDKLALVQRQRLAWSGNAARIDWRNVLPPPMLMAWIVAPATGDVLRRWASPSSSH